ncbi:hypothetical protein ACFY3N_29810 [Streptomyces sp. NPDC000348]|uniref:hypothetical protein n=1 Tax=Streptomyces sp. NPDC000348 TaxID=3364538 RepID=UPI00367E6DC6
MDTGTGTDAMAPASIALAQGFAVRTALFGETSGRTRADGPRALTTVRRAGHGDRRRGSPVNVPETPPG